MAMKKIDSDNYTLQRFLKVLKDFKGSQKAFADSLGIDGSYITRIKNGERDNLGKTVTLLFDILYPDGDSGNAQSMGSIPPRLIGLVEQIQDFSTDELSELGGAVSEIRKRRAKTQPPPDAKDSIGKAA